MIVGSSDQILAVGDFSMSITNSFFCFLEHHEQTVIGSLLNGDAFLWQTGLYSTYRSASFCRQMTPIPTLYMHTVSEWVITYSLVKFCVTCSSVLQITLISEIVKHFVNCWRSCTTVCMRARASGACSREFRKYFEIYPKGVHMSKDGILLLLTYLGLKTVKCQHTVAGNFRWCKNWHKSEISLRIKFRSLMFEIPLSPHH